MTLLIPQASAPARDRAPRYRKFESPRLSHRFFGPRHILSLTLGVLVLLILLFPRPLINMQLGSGMTPSAATLAYLRLQLRAKPDARELRLKLAQAELRAGQLEPATRTARPLLADPSPESALLWLHLQRARYVAAEPGSAARDRARETYRQALVSLAPQLGTRGLLGEMHNAVQSGLYDTASMLAERLLSTPLPAAGGRPRDAAASTRGPGLRLDSVAGAAWSVSPSASAPSLASTARIDPGTRRAVASKVWREAFDVLVASRLAAGDPAGAARAAQRYVHLIPPERTDWPHLLQVARWADRPDIGAALAHRWLNHAPDDATRWKAFNALIDAYLAADKPRQALAAAQADLDRMPPSTQLWRRMTTLAMQAGDADRTALYARRMVNMKDADGQ